ncbi:MAG: hypothetical protein ABSE46_26105 [Terracidiphilus sp.]|jgi:hypothetical protein
MLRAIAAAKKKDDRIDAGKIANCLRCDFLPEWHIASTEIRDRSRVLRYRTLVVKQMVQMKNRVSGLLVETGVSYNKQRLHKVGYFGELTSAKAFSARGSKWMSGAAGMQRPTAVRHLCAADDPDPRNARPPERALRSRVFSGQMTNMDVEMRISALRFLYKRTMKRPDLPFDDLVFPKVPHKLPIVLRQEEIVRLIDAAPNRLYCVLLLRLYATGARRAEAARIKGQRAHGDPHRPSPSNHKSLTISPLANAQLQRIGDPTPAAWAARILTKHLV